MPDISEKEWTEQDDRNAEQQPNGWPGGMPAYIDTVGRMMMGAVKRFWRRSNPFYLTTGAGDDYVVEPEVSFPRFNEYEILRLRIDRANTTTSPTLKFGEWPAAQIRKASSGGVIDLSVGDLVAGADQSFWYDGTQFILSNPGTLDPGIAAGLLHASANLSDLDDPIEARDNLGLGTAAIEDASAFATAAQGETADSALQPSAIGDTVQAHSVNLDTLAAVTPGAAGTSILALAAATDVRNFLDTAPYAATRAVIKALDTTKDLSAILLENGREGIFSWRSGDFSAQIAADIQEGIYLKADAIASTAGAWVRVFTGAASFKWFGAVGNEIADDNAAVTGALALGIRLDGGGLTYKVSAVPADFTNIARSSFLVGSVRYISSDYLRTDTAKITSSFIYAGWAEDKSYVVGDQIRVWSIEKESHADGTGRIVLYFSDDGGSSYSPGEYLDLAASGRTLWCAGYSGTTEYLIVRVPSGSTDVPPYTYERWSRTITLDSTGNLNTTPWTVTAITFPTPAGFTGQPIMVISFTTGHGGSIVVGTSYTEGAAVARSTDGGATWASFILLTGTDNEEPTVKYDPTTQRYYGFMRNGGVGNPKYWHSGVDDLSTISTYTAPAGTFGANGMNDSPVPFQIRNGRIHAFSSYRNGTLEGASSDELTSAFYMDMPLVAGNIWSQTTTKIYRLGTLPHRETGGASAVGVGSVSILEDKVHLFYGMEERTGAFASLNRIANIYQTVVFLTDRNGMFDFRNDLAADRSTGPFRRMPNNGGLALYLGDASADKPAMFSGRPNFAFRNSPVVIASGVATLSGRYGHYQIDTEGGVAADDLDTLTDPNAQIGDVIVLSTAASTRDVTVKNGTGNILCGSDRVLSNARDRIMLEYTDVTGAPVWSMISFSDNAA